MEEAGGWLVRAGRLLLPAVALAAGAYFLYRVFRTNAPRAAGSPSVPTPASVDPSARRTARRTAVLIAVSGFWLPWIVGLAVKAWLDAHGRPTYPVSGFLSPPTAAVLIAATIGMWCWPFLVLAWWVGSRHFPRFAPRRPFRDRLLLARLTHLGGLVGGVVVFLPVFREWDTIYIIVPLGMFLLVPMVGGYGLGVLLLRLRGPGTGAAR